MSAVACFTKLGKAMPAYIAAFRDKTCPEGKVPRLFAKVFSTLPKGMTEEQFANLKEFPKDARGAFALFGDKAGEPFDYLTLHREGVGSKSWRWESMNWSKAWAAVIKTDWKVTYQPFGDLHEESVPKNTHYGPAGRNSFKYVIYCVVCVDAKHPVLPSESIIKLK